MPIELELYIGDAKTEALRRGDKRVFCKEPEFDDMVCMPTPVFECFYRLYVLKVPCVDPD